MFVRTGALVLVSVAIPAAAQTTDSAVKPKAERKICRSYEETGSIMGGKKVCHSKAEWSAIDQRNSNDVSSSRDVNGHNGPMGPGRIN